MNTTEVLYRPHHKTIATVKGLFYGVVIIFACWAATLAWQACSELASRGEKQLTSYLIERQMSGDWQIDNKGATVNGRKISLEEARRALILLKNRNEALEYTIAEVKGIVGE